TEDTLLNLLEYGSGTTVMADIKNIEILRYDTENDRTAETIYVDGNTGVEGELRNRDVVTVPSKLLKLPAVFFEGALAEPGELGTGTVMDVSNRVRYVFEEGEYLSTALYNLEGYFTQVSDLENAYIIKADGSAVSLDLQAILYEKNGKGDLPLAANNRIIIPFKQYFVSVSGAVSRPGRYPYIPDRTYEYYVDLAGGFDTERHSGNVVSISDINGNSLRQRDFIGPESKIVAPNNNVFYFLGKAAIIVSLVSSVTAAIAAIISVFGL
ncbi:MAG: hypothetical protein HN368_00490, partial [Spirochaetales bacterium]|nr:hypothetical protein [Spirochaetales bacterium]